jgi:putative transposase
MKYNPEIHHRRSIRLRGYDYSQAGLYFITICTKDREYLFGKIADGEMVLNDAGKIAFDEWVKLPERFPNFDLDVFQIMPNHMHGIIVLNDIVGATLAVAPESVAPESVDQNDTASNIVIGTTARVAPTVAQNDNDETRNDDGDNRARVNHARTDRARTGVRTATIGDIVGAYKSLVANECLKIYKTKNKTMGKLWQRNYYEHIIRDEQSYRTISNYIIENPAKWNDDKFFIE